MNYHTLCGMNTQILQFYSRKLTYKGQPNDRNNFSSNVLEIILSEPCHGLSYFFVVVLEEFLKSCFMVFELSLQLSIDSSLLLQFLLQALGLHISHPCQVLSKEVLL